MHGLACRWNENLSDSNLKRMFDCTPPNLQVSCVCCLLPQSLVHLPDHLPRIGQHCCLLCAQVQKMDFTMHVCQNMSRSSFELLGTMTGLTELTLVNSSTVSNAGVLIGAT